ncbi:MAG: ATP-binding cassette domain-containing protein [Paracoccaceae bacterium]
MVSTDPLLAIDARGLTKRYGALVALDGVDLAVPQGSIFAVLGPNGAGKTTMVRMLATLERPDAGTASVMQADLRTAPGDVRKRVSLTGQFASLDEDLTGRENLVLLSRLWGFRGRQAGARADALLEAFQLSDAGHKQVQGYSGGMRRRLDIAASLIVTPGVLFLDEPTTGLDPAARQRVWGIIRQLAGAGVTILLTTQYLEEADQLADRIAVLNKGQKIAEGTSRALKAQIGTGVLHVTLANPQQAEAARALLADVLATTPQVSPEGAVISVPVPSANAATEALGLLRDHGVDTVGFSMGAPSLEEVFFALTGTGDDL